MLVLINWESGCLSDKQRGASIVAQGEGGT
jgi:hypothetical protein